jgi:hypothetical protein
VRRIPSTCRIVSLAAMICSLLLISSCRAEAQPQPSTLSSPPSLAESLKHFLETWDSGKYYTDHYLAAFRDLNDDGKLEAIIYLNASKWCGSGGCNTLILTQHGPTWRIVTNITITRPPIRILKTMSHGWHSIGVWVQGGGIQLGYEAELRFNGKTYPSNPTAAPARRLPTTSAGEVVINRPSPP